MKRHYMLEYQTSKLQTVRWDTTSHWFWRFLYKRAVRKHYFGNRVWWEHR